MTLDSNRQNGTLPLNEVRRLISARCDGRIGPEELRQLEEELADNPASRSLYIHYLDLHAGLGWEVTARQRVGELTRETFLASGIASVDESAHTTRKPLFLPLAIKWLVYGVAVTLLGAVGFGVWWSVNSKSIASRTEKSVASSAVSQADVQNANRAPILGQITDQSPDCVWFMENRAQSDDRSIRVGEVLRILEGEISFEYKRGVSISLSAPATYEFTSPMSGHLVRGQLKARVEKGAEGFAVRTPRANVVDFGTVFGINVNGVGSTDVVVFEGEVEVQYDSKNGDRLAVLQKLRMGQGIRVDEVGTASRLVAITSSSFPGSSKSKAQRRPLIISAVRDNIKRPSNWSYYEIVHAGLQEDAPAFVDREFHQWNGIDSSGMPKYLLGADYVRMFNDDKVDSGFEMYVTVDRPAKLLVFFDDRLQPPKWLLDNFENTGDKIGMDVGPFTEGSLVFTADKFDTGVGPGDSVENTLSIWQKRVPVPTTIRLGATETPNTDINMYAVAAIPLEDDAE